MAKSKALKVVEPKRQDVRWADEPNFFTEYSKVAAMQGSIIGQLLRFSKGEYIAGQDSEEVPEGTELVANMDQLLVGWQRWEDQRPVEQAMGPLSEGFQPQRRDELSFTDSSEWEIDEASGKPRDPWVYTHYLLLKEAGKKGQMYTFTTNSAGGKNAMGKLAGEYGKEMREHPDEYPIIKLEVGSYMHSNAAYGRIKFPIFKIVGWADKSEFEDAAETPATASAKRKIK